MDFIAAETINAATADYMHFISPLHLSSLILLTQTQNANLGIMPILFLINAKSLVIFFNCLSTLFLMSPVVIQWLRIYHPMQGT